MNDFNIYDTAYDQAELETEHRNDIESQLIERAEQQVIRCLNLNNMDELARLCDEHNQELDVIIDMLIKDERNGVMACFIYHNATDGEIEAMAKMVVYYFDFTQAVDEAIELEQDLAL